MKSWTLLLLAGTLAAVDFGALQPQGRVSDFARVIEPGARAQLEQYCARLEQASGVELALVTLDTLAGEPIEDVANLLFRKWGVGKKATNEGALLLLVIGDRRSRLEVGYGLEPVIPDGFAGSVLREMRPALREQHYSDALLTAAKTLGDRIASSKGVTINTELRPRRARPRESAVPWPLIMFGAVALLWLVNGFASAARGGRSGILPALLLGNMLGRSGYGSRASGGFGGYDSSDSFGGFGGGDSGGGGASSDW